MSREQDVFLSRAADTATLGVWLAFEVKRNLEARQQEAQLSDNNLRLLESAKKVMAASKKTTAAFNAMSSEEKKAFHAFDD
jgi:hypothetical protein